MAVLERLVITILVGILAYVAYHEKEKLQEMVLSREYKALSRLDSVIGSSKSKYTKVAVGYVISILLHYKTVCPAPQSWKSWNN